MIRAALYLRVSTRNGQSTDNQRAELEAVAAARGWDVVEVYEDQRISGAKGRDQRPALDRMLRDTTRGRVNLIAAWSVDRLGRSLQDLIGFLTELEAMGCGLYLHKQAVDTTTPSGRALFQMLGVFAEFERAIIQERVCAGLSRARAQGKRLGRPRIAPAREQAIREALLAGKGIRRITREQGVGTSAVQRIKAELAAAGSGGAGSASDRST